ncbi:hypothetical protein WMF38_52675 [Sorangium sp. So ce118]
MKKPARLALKAALGVVAVVVLAALNLGTLVRLAMAPGAPFDAGAPPPAPDYADPRSWSALPERDDAGDLWPTGAPAVDQRRAAADESGDRAPRLGLVGDARCVDGTLVLHHVGATPRDLTSRILDRVMGDGNYHPIEYQLFFMNIRENAASRLAAFLSAAR